MGKEKESREKDDSKKKKDKQKHKDQQPAEEEVGHMILSHDFVMIHTGSLCVQYIAWYSQSLIEF